MDRKSKDGMPRYQQIAMDIATQIVKQQYKVGDRIYARSALASKYHVSPETARRAICLLADMDIVEAEKGSGVVILSVEKAMQYLQQLTGVETMTEPAPEHPAGSGRTAPVGPAAPGEDG